MHTNDTKSLRAGTSSVLFFPFSDVESEDRGVKKCFLGHPGPGLTTPAQYPPFLRAASNPGSYSALCFRCTNIFILPKDSMTEILLYPLYSEETEQHGG